jgi:two-component system, LytTR family, response regulator
MTKMRPLIRVIIVDDESPARRKVNHFLAEEEDFEVVGEAGTGLEAVRVIRQKHPDLVFLDVQMPGLDGFAVLQSLDLEPLPQIVFTTAFDQFAIRAFEVHALDYLLKPFDHTRFKSVLQRAREHWQLKPQEGLSDRVTRLLEELAGRERYAERLLVTAGDRALLLAIDKIDLIEAAKNYVNIHAGRDAYLLRGTLEALYQKLDPAKFIRANRSQVVNLGSIKELHPWFHGEYKIILRDGKEITWSRRYLDQNSDRILKRL